MTAEVEAHALLPWLVTAAAVFGFIIGSFLSVLVWRVPRGESPAACSRCMSVRHPFIEFGTAAVFALVAWWAVLAFGWPGAGVAATAWWLALAAYLAFAAASVALTLIDLGHRRLPDSIVLPSLVAITLLLLAADWSRAGATLIAAIALFALYLTIALLYPPGLGGGDVKLAPLVGAVLGFTGWGSLVVGASAAFALGAVVGLVLIATRRATRKSTIPFGPYMLLGAWVGIVWGAQIARACLGLFGPT